MKRRGRARRSLECSERANSARAAWNRRVQHFRDAFVRDEVIPVADGEVIR